MLDCENDEELIQEGLAREVINRVQMLRKEANMFPTQKANAFVNFVTPNSVLVKVLEKNQDLIQSQTNTALVMKPLEGNTEKHLGRYNIKEDELELALVLV